LATSRIPAYARLGYQSAIWAVAHRLCRVIWKILHEGVRFSEQGRELDLHYIAANGSDANDGTSKSTPWAPARHENMVRFSGNESWDRMLEQGIMLLIRFCQDDRIHVGEPRRNLEVKFTRPVARMKLCSLSVPIPST